MSRTFFRKRVAEGEGIAPAPRAGACPAGGEAEAPGDKSLTENAIVGREGNDGKKPAGGRAGQDPGHHQHRQTDSGTFRDSGDGVERHAAIYDDTDVCRALGLLRRTVVRARQAGRRGVDWDCVDRHGGMTLGWIRQWNANVNLGGVKPIGPGDGIVTVQVTGRVMNGDVVQARRVADGTCVTVRGIRNAWYLHVGDEIDCRMQGGMLTFAPELNRERY